MFVLTYKGKIHNSRQDILPLVWFSKILRLSLLPLAYSWTCCSNENLTPELSCRLLTLLTAMFKNSNFLSCRNFFVFFFSGKKNISRKWGDGQECFYFPMPYCVWTSFAHWLGRRRFFILYLYSLETLYEKADWIKKDRKFTTYYFLKSMGHNDLLAKIFIRRIIRKWIWNKRQVWHKR